MQFQTCLRDNFMKFLDGNAFAILMALVAGCLIGLGFGWNICQDTHHNWVELHKTPTGIFYFETNKKGEKIIFTASELKAEETRVGSYR